MGVLATFDAAGQWGDTHVCDSLIAQHLADHGVAWGRWEDPGTLPADAPLAAVLDSRQAEIAQLRERFLLQSADQLHLEPEAADWPALRRQWRAEHRREGVEVRCVLEGTQLLYLRIDQGYLAVLCEAGEWVALPAHAARVFDAGDSPELNVLRLWSGAEIPVIGPSSDVISSLPLLDAFVETMLELTGHAAEEE